MKTKKTELDFDFIGSQTPLTKEKESLITECFSKENKSRISRSTKKAVVRRKPKVSV